MSDPKSNPPKVPAATEKPETGKKSGRVVFDARGNAVWEWQMSTGIYGRNIDTRRLKKLEAKDLKITDEPGKEGESGAKHSQQSGFDPYNSSNTSNSVKTRALKQVMGDTKPAAKPQEPRRPGKWLSFKKSPKKKDA